MIPPNQMWSIDRAYADSILPQRSEELITYLRGLRGDFFAEVLGAPNELHRSLYRELTPLEHPEFAGNYRGSAFPALRRCVVSSAFSAVEGTPLLIPPGDVAAYMVTYAHLVKHVVAEAREPSPRAIEQMVSVMIVFGKIHPFLDGNGHIQRLTFQVMAERSGYTTPAWRVHPKLYGEAIDRLKASGNVQALATALSPYLTS